MITIAIFTFNRAEYSKLKPIIRALKRDKQFDVKLVVGGSHQLYHYGNTINLIREDFEVDYTINTLIYGENLKTIPESVGLCMSKIPQVLEEISPDCVLIHGDRFDVMGAALCAYLMNIYVTSSRQ